MTLPAHRFRDRAPEERKKQSEGQRVWLYDYDGTLTHAPEQLTRIAVGLRALGDRNVVLTGSEKPRETLLKQLADWGFPYDELVQYHDEGTDGLDRAEYMKQFDAWAGFDNRVDRAVVFADVCPVFYVVGKPIGERTPGTKQDAKQAAKEAKRSERRGSAPPPPNLRVSDSSETGREQECGTCVMFDQGRCWGYGNFPVNGEWVCDSWQQDPDWQEQDDEQDAEQAN